MNKITAALVGGLFDESGVSAYARPVLFGTAGDAVRQALPDTVDACVFVHDDREPAVAGADSLALLRHVAALVETEGYRLGNLDATVLAQVPKLAPHIGQMRENIASAIGCEVGRVSVKATTEEKLGFTGAKQGIAAHCVCLLEECREP